MQGLIVYLAGPGRSNEHTNPHLVAGRSELGMFSGRELDRQDALDIASFLDEARVVFGTEVTRVDRGKKEALLADGKDKRTATADATKDVHVWHCSLSLHSEEGEIGDEVWGKVATEFMKRMGFDDPAAAPVRWGAFHHGLNTNGNDHIHIAASRVRDDGSVVDLYPVNPETGVKEGDWTRAQRVCADLEREFGLRITEGRANKLTERGQNKAEAHRAEKAGADLTERQELARRVRAAATASSDEKAFVTTLRRSGVLVRPRYAKGGRDQVIGYSVALRPGSIDENVTGKATTRDGKSAPLWYGGSKLAKDLSLVQLRNGWASTAESERAALDAWSARKAERGPQMTAPQLLEAKKALDEFSAHIARLAPDDHQGWADAARTTAGMLAQLSLNGGGDKQLAQASRALGACSGAMIPRTVDPIAVKRRASAAHATMLMGMAAQRGNTNMMFALLMKQLSDMSRAIAEARSAGVDAARAAAAHTHAETMLSRYQSAAEAIGGVDGAVAQLTAARAIPGAAKPTVTPRRGGPAQPAPRRGTAGRPHGPRQNWTIAPRDRDDRGPQR
ncbi:relaxase/mobilization nuclease domain-containing protein [Tsukamurella columbiensis]|uniref:MobA/VirD2-like nuclease domain-containing protein n=1 Tax=Tsukamurella columbiensis TaxID=128509 RepID=A0ABX1LMZ3_9ACTN|nr:hypothetical protein [Tsukamurella columbiensis]NMD58328.1 hypothetical protein [Tsukamurella columbiensis]